jgi:hypothetical protein
MPICFAGFSCKSNEDKVSLYFTKSDLSELEIVELEFAEVSFLPGIFNCAAFLEQLSSSFSIQQKLTEESFQPLLTFSDSKAARLTGHLRDEIYKQCSNFHGCSLLFPFSMLSPRRNKTNLEQMFKEKLPICLEKKKTFPQARPIIPPSELFGSKEIFDISERKITDEFLKIYNSQNWDKIYVSSMTLSAGFIKKIIEKANANSAEIHILFSLSLQSLLKEFPSYLFELPSNVKVHAIFPSPFAVNAYHIKGALFLGKKPKFMFFTGNFRNYDDSFFSDLAMIADVKDPKSLEDHFLSQINYNCEQQAYLDCTLKARFENNSSIQELIKRLVTNSCMFTKTPDLQKIIAFGPRYYEMKKLLHEKLRAAKKSIYIHTHQFNDDEMLEILDQKIKQGIEVKIINGSNKLVKGQNRSYFLQNKSLKDLHSKYMIIDKQMLIWGTSNYTTTGYSNFWEMTFIYQEPQIIEEFIKRFKAAETIIQNGSNH